MLHPGPVQCSTLSCMKFQKAVALPGETKMCITLHAQNFGYSFTARNFASSFPATHGRPVRPAVHPDVWDWDRGGASLASLAKTLFHSRFEGIHFLISSQAILIRVLPVEKPGCHHYRIPQISAGNFTRIQQSSSDVTANIFILYFDKV